MLIKLSEIHRKWGRQNRPDRAKARPSRMSNWWACVLPPLSCLFDCMIVYIRFLYPPIVRHLCVKAGGGARCAKDISSGGSRTLT
jgi:hypothetical protein